MVNSLKVGHIGVEALGILTLFSEIGVDFNDMVCSAQQASDENKQALASEIGMHHKLTH